MTAPSDFLEPTPADRERCDTCQVRHEPGEECAEAGEEGHISRNQLLEAFRLGLGVCLACQTIWLRERDDRCPGCGGPCERFSEDDLEDKSNA